jgi:hypothetical protein
LETNTPHVAPTAPFVGSQLAPPPPPPLPVPPAPVDVLEVLEDDAPAPP